MAADEKIYFAYGSNLGQSILRRPDRCPRAEQVGIARVDGYRLGFTRHSERRGGGVADLVEAVGSVVWGALFDLSLDGFDALDKAEGVAIGAYARNIWKCVRVIYAMKVTKKMTIAEYDAHTRTKLRKKVPDWGSSNMRRQVGDSIYDFSRRPDHPKQRKSVHRAGNVKTDLRGGHALLSTHFYNFGDKAIHLPPKLRDIAQNRQGHRRHLNDPYPVRGRVLPHGEAELEVR
jgi:hypothetical protein